MITLKIPKKETMPLYQVIQNYGDIDIGDNTYDWGVGFSCPDSWEECEDYYDRFLLLLAINIECIHPQPDWYSTCLVSEFISKNIKAFRKFFNEENREGYRPMDYENSDDYTVDEGFYDSYLLPLEGLIVGNYAEEDYEKIYKLLTKEVK